MDNDNKNLVVIGTIAAVVSASVAVLTYLNVKPHSSEKGEVVQKVSNPKNTGNKEKVYNVDSYAGAAKAVDLGLSVKWAEWNIGASCPQDFGDYYAWGEIETKRNYSIRRYRWCKDWHTNMTKYCTNKQFGKLDGKDVLDAEDDVANVKWGGGWRIPSQHELRELIRYCTWSLSEKNGTKGFIVTGRTGNSIFLPFAGYRENRKLYDSDSSGYYLSCDLHPTGSHCMLVLKMGPDDNIITGELRSKGFSVRPVCE